MQCTAQLQGHVSSCVNVQNGRWHFIGRADPGSAGASDSSSFSSARRPTALSARTACAIAVWLEHGDATKEVMGEVVYSWVDDDGLFVVVQFDDSSRSRALKTWIKNGLYTGLSLGYTSSYDQNYNVLAKDIFEVSIVHDPFHKNCRVLQIIEPGDADRSSKVQEIWQLGIEHKAEHGVYSRFWGVVSTCASSVYIHHVTRTRPRCNEPDSRLEHQMWNAIRNKHMKHTKFKMDSDSVLETCGARRDENVASSCNQSLSLDYQNADAFALQKPLRKAHRPHHPSLHNLAGSNFCFKLVHRSCKTPPFSRHTQKTI